MKCPRCGSEMTMDTHRKYSLNMCYECGYMEGRSSDGPDGKTNFQHMKGLNINELASFLASGLSLELEKVQEWLAENHK